MSYFTEDPDFLSQEEIDDIQDEYRKKRLVESLIGPSISTVFHILLVVLLGIFICDRVQDPVQDIEVTILPVEPLPEVQKKITEPDIKPLETKVDLKVELNMPLPDTKPEDSSLDNTDDKDPTTDENLDMDKMSDVEVSVSPTASPSVIGSRFNRGKRGLYKSYNVDSKAYDSFLKCLEWLAKVQNVDGSWGNDAKGGYTGLALLTFLAHGETPTSKRYGRTVKAAMKWLTNDKIDTSSHHAYPHAIKTYALAEAYAMTGISLLEEKMNQCVKIIIKGQQSGGAYDYNYRASENRQDLSFSGWNYQALKAAKIAGCEAAGLDDAIYKSLAYLKIMGESEKSFAYTTSNSDPDNAQGSGKWTMRAVGTLSLQLLEPGAHKILKDELDGILADGKVRFNWNKAPKRALYGWYYETNAMFHAQGKYWRGWKDHFAKVLMANQHPEGYWVYPGENHIPGNNLSSKIYATTLSALMLSVPIRYLPSSKVTIDPEPVKEAKAKEEKLMKEEFIDLIE